MFPKLCLFFSFDKWINFEWLFELLTKLKTVEIIYFYMQYSAVIYFICSRLKTKEGVSFWNEKPNAVEHCA